VAKHVFWFTFAVMQFNSKTLSIPFQEIPDLDISTQPEYVRKVCEFIKDWLTYDLRLATYDFTIKTSGSTGEPKDFILRRELMIESAELTGETFNLSKGDTLLCCLDMGYIAGLMMAVRALVLDCNLYVVEASGNPLQDIDKNQKLDFAAFVPLQLEKIIEETLEKLQLLNQMKAILVGGGPVSQKLENLLQKITAPVYHTYSMTETYTHIAIRQLNVNPSPFYYPLEGVKISQDERGCLCVSSPVTEGELLITNDLIELNPDGSFLWLGRADNIINSGGIKVQAEKIESAAEAALKKMGIEGLAVMAVGLPDEKLGQKIVLLVESDMQGGALKLSILAELKKNLPRYEVPKDVMLIPQFERTRTGKLQRGETVGKLG